MKNLITAGLLGLTLALAACASEPETPTNNTVIVED